MRRKRERVLPGTFNRLITMAENLQAAQISQSIKVLDLTHATNTRGQWLGFAATILAMGGALGCVAASSKIAWPPQLSIKAAASASGDMAFISRPI
jgi:hypothetical protein